MADFYAGRVQSARSRLSPKRLADRINENVEHLQNIGGGEQGQMKGAGQIMPEGVIDFEVAPDPTYDNTRKRR